MTRKVEEEIKKIITNYVCPPIPVRRYDWEAYREGYDEGDPIGQGETEEDAINELLDMESDLDC